MKALLSNPRIVVLAIALLVVAGLGSVNTLPRLEDPRITNRHGIVIVHFPGAAAERVEALVIEPLERKLREVPEVEHISATARAGIASITVELRDEVGPDEADEMWMEVREKVDQARSLLPAGASEPTLDSERGHAYTWIGALSWRGTGNDILQVGRYAEELANRLNNLDGTDIVRLYGMPGEEIRVDADPVRIASVGLDVQQIAALVRQSDAKVSAGEIHNPHHRMSLEVSGAFEQIERIRQIPLITGDTGASLQLGDIADVERGEKTPAKEYAIVDDQRAVMVAVRMLPQFRGDRWTEKLQAEVDAFRAELPVELQVRELFVQERYNDVRLRDLVGNIVLGFSFIVLVLWWTLGWRSALLVAAALPLTLLFSLSVMRLVNLPIHQMSVTGLIVALGIMVDNAIVTADTVMRFRKDGYSAVAAATRAVRHLWLPLLGSTLTTVLSFMPIVLMPGPSGEFIGGIAFAVIFSLLGSWLISLFVIAPVAGRWLSKAQAHGLQLPWLGKLFRGSLSGLLRLPRTTMLLVLLLPVLGFVGASRLPEQFFPASDRDMINLEVYLPSFAGLEATREASEKITAVLKGHESILETHWMIGRSVPSFYYNLMQGKDGNQNYAQAMITTRDFDAANQLVPMLQRELDDTFPQWQIVVRRLEQGPPASAPVELRLQGSDLEALMASGDELRRVALMTEDVVHVRASLGETVPKIYVEMDPVYAGVGGSAQTQLAAKLQADLDGVTQGSLLEGTEQLPVRIRARSVGAFSINELELLPITLPEGPRPLMALADTRLLPSQAVITRRDAERVNTISVFIRDGVLPSVVLNRIKDRLEAENFQLPAGYRLEIGGEDENRDQAVGKLMSSVGVILVLTLVTVVMAFNSFRFALVIFAVAGQAAGLGLLSLSMTPFPFGFTSIVAMMGLIGLAVNAAIVILTELKTNPQAMAGNRQAIVESVAECTRHITSTTITTVVGLMPLILSGGGFWPPFAVVLAGGTVLTTLLSLYFVPSAFLVLRKPAVSKLWRPAQVPAEVSAPVVAKELGVLPDDSYRVA